VRTNSLKSVTTSDHPWAGLKSIIAVTAKREIPGKKITEETRYFISSLGADNPHKAQYAVRAHWAIENNLHWVLDYQRKLP